MEFVVLNYNSQDDLHEWIMGDPEMREHMQSGVLKYWRTTEPEEYHSAHAKNMAHRLATGDVLCNADADNFLGFNFANFLYEQFSQDMNLVMNPSRDVLRSPEIDNGVCGRVAMTSDHFHMIGGYDEARKGWGGDDTNLLHRAQAYGLKYVRFDTPKYLSVIAHSDEDRVSNMGADNAEREQYLDHLRSMKGPWSLMKIFRHKARVLGQKVKVQQNGAYGLGEVQSSFGLPLRLRPEISSNSLIFNRCARGLPQLIRNRFSPRIARDKNAPQSTSNFAELLH